MDTTLAIKALIIWAAILVLSGLLLSVMIIGVAYFSLPWLPDVT